MNDIGLDFTQAGTWFAEIANQHFLFIQIDDTHIQTWAGALGVPLRRCYISDYKLEERSSATGLSRERVLSSKLPDPGSIMSGDFAEFLTYIFHAAREDHRLVISPEKWRLKETRTKTAPYSDVVHFVLPTWPAPSAQDVLICSEVKGKATRDPRYSPINRAIEGMNEDRTSRLAKTLTWLRDKAISEGVEGVSIEQLERFINATDFPAATKKFNAVAVICSTLVNDELLDVPTDPIVGFNLIVISVANLYNAYMSVFESAKQSVADGVSAVGQQGQS